MTTIEADSPQMPKLLVGLGNPGQKYERTRHNIGFEIIDNLAKAWSVPLSDNKRFQGHVAETRAASGDRLILLKPSTYMNLSGQSVRSVLDWYKLQPIHVLVIYDDMDLPIGKLRMRMSGSAGGHNGMKSIISHLGTQDFPRLRLGISRVDGADKQANRAVVGHVLGKFAPDERKVVDAAINLAGEAIEFSLGKGIERAMSLYNGREATV
ncbi:aminoacyl-tRNA hydrolase [Leptothoe sp. PORK10 BA2]|uniref:aminoacyl-tRNA hydrolase n=1 Tax=Leptothoe sp. PORK10 BA2 TaxID=3110254 RepID=UPI002B2138AE|nr:aminoacyl-tRNA hydrolase [Leptothoe sp. PORK10 BA2]MEA5462952.1 aminoacyl-tRNA hydrolase [Leptothoe sp. PORK10 BA2]